MIATEQRGRAGYSEMGKSGSERGLCKPTAAMRQGGAFLLYPIQYTSLDTEYWQNHLYAFGRLVQD